MRPPHLPTLAGLMLAGVLAVGCGTLGSSGELVVRVVDLRTGKPVGGATVEADWQVRRTGPNGFARFTLKPAGYELLVEHAAYEPSTSSLMLGPGATLSRTVGLQPRPGGPAPSPGPTEQPGSSPAPSPGASTSPDPGVVVMGKVTDGKGGRVANALMLAESTWGVPLAETRTNGVGEFRLQGLPRAQAVKVTAIAAGHAASTRVATPAGEWRMDFTGIHSLVPERPPISEPGGPPLVKVDTLVVDGKGDAVEGAVVRAEVEGPRFPFQAVRVVKYGHAEFTCPAEVPVRFTATKVGHRPVTFVERLEPGAATGPVRIDFKGGRALVANP